MSRESVSKEHISSGDSDVIVAAAGFGAIFRETAYNVHYTDTVCTHTLVPHATDIP